ncbi:hypothetical protein MNV_910007 [Candidatus Methanoperedens nitroreducens]|uniref:Uncharacterized protein n=1 Tax=Candidatus Methanoperedens nitratireducens TaxID=1392998 RepID=A0A284VUI0_9EURY|nr:hypothetical protein MNV_910007 [Candidatus Methanoperedens nitroreducens]
MTDSAIKFARHLRGASSVYVFDHNIVKAYEHEFHFLGRLSCICVYTLRGESDNVRIMQYLTIEMSR